MLSTTRLAFVPLGLVLATAALAQTADSSRTPGTGAVASSLFHAPTDAPFVYTNGPYVTGIGNGVGGANTSMIETGWNTYGYGTQGGATNNRIADDFVVPAGQSWTLAKLHWLAYQTGASTAGTITGIQVNLWNTMPVTGGSPMWSSAANVMLSQTWTNVYRVLTPPGDTLRAIMDVQADLSGSPVLAPGTYWVDVQLVGTLTSGPWSNPTVPYDATDNGRQFTGSSATWQPVADSLTLLPQDFPFALEGDDGAGCGTAVSYCVGKTNSLGCVPSISLTGTVSASAGSGAPLVADNVIGHKWGLFMHSTAGAASTPFHNGTLCLASPQKRHVAQLSTGASGTCAGVFAEDLNAYIASGADPALVAGAQVWLQNWSRDPGDSFFDSLSDAVTVLICP